MTTFIFKKDCKKRKKKKLKVKNYMDNVGTELSSWLMRVYRVSGRGDEESMML